MRNCPKCGTYVPKFYNVNGKRHNCQKRKYCFNCSPFGEHNTRKIEISNPKVCIDCGNHHKQNGRRCPVCNFNKRRIETTEKVQSIVGTSCWKCGYNRTWRNICFHHVIPTNKLMGLSSREYMLSWNRVFAEMQKCVLLCHNCHGEVHEGIISAEEISNLYQDKWKQIKVS